MIAMMAVALGLSGCSKSDKINEDEDEPGNGNNGGNTSGFVIEAKNVESSRSTIVKVEATVDLKKYTATYSNKSFKLTLPNNISDISDGRNTLFIAGLNKNNEIIGIFNCRGYKGNTSYSIGYSYASENFVYTRENSFESEGYTFTSTYNCDLKKGWNIEYCEGIIDEDNKTVTYTTTTKKTSGVNFTWDFASTE